MLIIFQKCLWFSMDFDDSCYILCYLNFWRKHENVIKTISGRHILTKSIDSLMWPLYKNNALTNGFDNILKKLCFWLQWEALFHFTLENVTFRALFERARRPSPNATFSTIFATTQKHMENVTFCAYLEERAQPWPNVTFSTVSTTFSLFHRKLSVHSLYQT